jgi:gamma-glutamylcyclotransferase (GGCT)/AIG2-like uncharacterized protein YtfP
MKKLVAVYGSLRKGLGNHRVLQDSVQVGEDTIQGWDMFSLGGFPGIKSGPGSIVIEVYEVVSEGVARGLDSLEGYRGENSPNNFYDKETVVTKYGNAEIYTLQEGYDGGKVEGGNWVTHRS